MNDQARRGRSRLGIVLIVIFLLAMVMGPGPGLRLINPDVTHPDATYTIGGLPIVYAWGLFWFAVQMAVVLTAYFTIWRRGD